MKKAKNLSLSAEILEKADRLKELLHQDDLSALVSRLIIDEWERRHGQLRFSDSMDAPPAAQGPPQKAPYKLRRRKRRKKGPPEVPLAMEGSG